MKNKKSTILIERTTLYVVATPIGNLEDISARAIRILSCVDTILCEDTRTTHTLLKHYGITTPTMSYHTHSNKDKHDKVIEMLAEGKNLALVSDAGTPCISDPGVILVRTIKEKFDDTVAIVAVPGPSALVSALSISGMPASEFIFLGFLPHKKGRETCFSEIAVSKRTVAFYESPHRILKALTSLQKHLGEKRQIVLAREMTKHFEETLSGNATELLTIFKENPEKIRGEFVVIVAALE